MLAEKLMPKIRRLNDVEVEVAIRLTKTFLHEACPWDQPVL